MKLEIISNKFPMMTYHFFLRFKSILILVCLCPINAVSTKNMKMTWIWIQLSAKLLANLLA